MGEREEYLDELLKEIDDEKDQEGKAAEVWDDFDKEMEGIDEEDFLKEFEKSLGDDLDSNMETEFSKADTSESEFETELGLDDDSTSPDFMDSIDSIVNNVKSGNLDDGFGNGDLSLEESLKNFNEEDPVLDEIGQGFATDDSYMTNESEEIELPEEADEISEAEKLAREIEGLNLSDETSETNKAEREEESSAEEKKAQEESKKQEKKKGFFARLSAALFGEEEEEEVVAPKPAAATIPADIENLSEDELSALRALESQNSSSGEDDEAKKKQEKAEEKKALKEQKAQEKAEKKAAKQALKEQKAKEKAEKKALKLQKQEPVVKSKPLPKKPVVLIILFGLSIVVLVNLLSGVSGYNTALAEAKEYYAQGEYVEAYGCLNEKDIKEADLGFYDKVRLTAYMQQQLNSYDAYQSQNMYSEALSALICGVGRYDRFVAEATEAGVDKEYDKMFKNIEEKLSSNYQMSVDEARAIYVLEDKKEFTYAVYEIISELRLESEEE